MDALVDKSRSVGGVPTSLKDLGYDMIGIDEGWEGCGMGVHGTQHYANGTPAIRADFPDVRARWNAMGCIRWCVQQGTL